ncbi:hypothetical protein CB1_001113020 [Camelus ferus]|nr:hypothetical protein CB1_001113020 [Camelus ferus]
MEGGGGSGNKTTGGLAGFFGAGGAGYSHADLAGVPPLLYSAFGVIIEKTRGAEDDLNTVAAGTMTGMLYKCTGGLRGVARGGLAGLTLTSLYALYNNWEHMKGSLLQQSL